MALQEKYKLLKDFGREDTIRILPSPEFVAQSRQLITRVGRMKCVVQDCPTCETSKPKTKAMMTAVMIQSRRHNAKKNGGKVQYHKRVQKKWDKRFKAEGANSKRAHYTKPVTIAMPQAVANKLRGMANGWA